MIKDFQYQSEEPSSALEYIERDIALHGEEHWQSMDDLEFEFHYGISKKDYIYHYSVDYSIYTNEKLVFARKDQVPFTEQSMEKMMQDFREESIKYLSAPKVTVDKSARKMRSAAKLADTTSKRPSQIKNTLKDISSKTGEKVKPVKKKRPEPKVAANNELNGVKKKARNELSEFKKRLLSQTRSSLGKRKINLMTKALKKAMEEVGAKWGSPEWVVLMGKFFPREKVTATPIPDKISSNENIGDEPQNDSAANPETEATIAETPSLENGASKEENLSSDEQTEISEEIVNSAPDNQGNSEQLESGNQGIENASVQQAMAINTSKATHAEGEDFVEGLIDETPTNFGFGIKNSAKALEDSQQTKVDAITENLPEIETPTGLVPNEGEALLDNSEQLNILNTGETPEIMNTESLVSKPVGETLVEPTIMSEGSLITEVLEPITEESDSDIVLDQIKNLPTKDENINTSPGEAPEVPLSAEADPAQVDNAQSEADAATETKKALADAAASLEIATQNITPLLDDEVLSSQLSELEAPQEIGAEIEIPVEVPVDIQTMFDEQAQVHLDEEASVEYAKHDQAILDLETESEQETEAKLAEIEVEKEITRQAQLEAQQEVKAETDQYKQEWQNENQAAIDEYKTNAEVEYGRTKQEIDAKTIEANQETQQIFRDAETEAQNEQEKSEQDASNQQEEVTEDKEGFLSRLGGAISDGFEKLKEGLNAIFDALRKLVKDIIDKAKKLAAVVIDLAKDFIVSSIKIFGEALKMFVSVAFAAFPEVAERFNGLIDQAVEFAVNKVNQLAEALKTVVNALLDLLGEVLDKILAAYQAVLNAILDVLEFIAVGILKILEGLANLGIALVIAVKDYFLGAMVEEALGTDITQPLNIERTPKEVSDYEGNSEQSGGDAGQETSETSVDDERQNQEVLDKPELSDSDVALPEGPAEISPELLKNLPQIKMGESIPLGENANPITREQLQAAFNSGGENIDGIADSIADSVSEDAMMDQSPEEMVAATNPNWAVMNDDEKLDHYINIMGAEPATPDGAQTGEAPEQEAASETPYIAKTNPLNVSKRISFVGRQMLKGMQMWWQKNQLKIYAAILGILIGAGVIAFFTGGAGLIAVLQVLMQVMTAYFIADAILRIKGHFYDYLQKAWDGKVEEGGKSLAKALAILVSEFVLEYLLKVVGKVLKKVKAALKGTKRAGKAMTGARKVVSRVSKVGKAVKETSKKVKNVVLTKGKFIFTKLNNAWMKVINTIGDLRQKILSKFGFKRMWMEKSGKFIELWADFNPKILLMRTDADGNSNYELHDVDTKNITNKPNGSVDFDTPNGRMNDGIQIDESRIITVQEPHPDFPNIYHNKQKVKMDDGTLVDVDYFNKHGVREDLVDIFPSGKPKNAMKYAGKEMPLPDNLRSKYGDDIPFTQDGYPDFDLLMERQGIEIRRETDFQMSGDRDLDIANVREKTTGFRTKNPEGFEEFTWHHHQDGKTMILVPTDLHKYVKHHGGHAITKAGL